MDEGGREDVKPVLILIQQKERGESGDRLPFLSIMMKKLLICVFILLQFGSVHAGEKRTQVPIGDSPSLGPADALVTIIEFIDFQ